MMSGDLMAISVILLILRLPEELCELLQVFKT